MIPRIRRPSWPRLNRGWRKGGLGVGFPIGYYTAASSAEVMAVAGVAKRCDSFITSHVRYLSQVPPGGSRKG